METILNEILTHLKTEVPELKYIAVDDGQLDNPDAEGNYPVLFPCVVLDIGAIAWTTTTDPEQSGEGEIVARFGWQSPGRFDSNASAASLAGAVSRWGLHDKISKALHGFSGANFGRLERVRSEVERREGLVKVMPIAFAFEGGDDLTPG